MSMLRATLMLGLAAVTEALATGMHQAMEDAEAPAPHGPLFKLRGMGAPQAVEHAGLVVASAASRFAAGFAEKETPTADEALVQLGELAVAGMQAAVACGAWGVAFQRSHDERLNAAKQAAPATAPGAPGKVVPFQPGAGGR